MVRLQEREREREDEREVEGACEQTYMHPLMLEWRLAETISQGSTAQQLGRGGHGAHPAVPTPAAGGGGQCGGRDSA